MDKGCIKMKMYNIFIDGVTRVSCHKCGCTYVKSSKYGHKSCPECGYDIHKELMDKVIEDIIKNEAK